MSEKVKLSKDGAQIDFIQSDSLPTSVKKFRQSPEIEGFYRFIFENDLQKEAYEILNKIIEDRKMKKALMKKEAKEAAKLEKIKVAPVAEKKVKAAAKVESKTAVKEKVASPAKVVPAAKKVAPAKPVKVAAKVVAKPAAKAKNVKAKAVPAKKTPKKK